MRAQREPTGIDESCRVVDPAPECIEALEFAPTLVWIEHDMQLLRDLADRATVLHYGRKLAEGSPQDVVSDTRVIESLSNPLFP